MNNTKYHLKKADQLGWGPGVARLNPQKVKLLDEFVQKEVIDIGCGSGIYTHYLSQKHSTVGVDIQKKFIESARQKYSQSTFQVASAYQLPFEDKQFNTAILFDVLEHLDEHRVLREASRVASRIILSVPHRTQPILLKYSLVHHHNLDKTHKRTYTINSLKKLSRQLDLQIVYLQPALPISLSGLLVSHLSGKNKVKRLLLKSLFKPFLPEPPIYSSIFAVLQV